MSKEDALVVDAAFRTYVQDRVFVPVYGPHPCVGSVGYCCVDGSGCLSSCGTLSELRGVLRR